jgi:glyoxylase-like metal-dependent hydrolase (beta-lactamase superfamily II)
VNALEHDLAFPWSQAPAPGEYVTLRPGVHWLRMPLPFALDHINLWLLDDEIDGVRGFTAIDCGIANDATRAAWEALFDRGFEGRPLLRVIATHFHPDHLGLADWLCQGGDRARWSCELWMTAAEYMIGRHLCGTSAGAGKMDPAPFREFFISNGMDPEQARERASARIEKGYAGLVPSVPGSYVRLFEGDRIRIGVGTASRSFRVITGFGHAPEHACLMCDEERLLISGDMVLPGISTNVSVYEVEPLADPLRRFLESIERLGNLPPDTFVLPSHGLPFTGLRERVAQLHAHHEDRLQRAMLACETPQTALQLISVLFRRALDSHQIGFAFGEALAHLHYLWYQGRLKRSCDADGVARFVRIPEAGLDG